ncbi:hypothetical protein SAMN06265338_11121 [Rhodoblastus acidophilus]|uniref:Uncharacterized protein n=1 Tax=Rhodoblastus acidophilus TaxID=1074 RepID=A0A212S326_RHOAC|nr:hypothetical protein [Rhodoblastus acidophilus]MCW2318175.1 hypothetical protein [Rhodoblastus acidophilus]SNB79389.1 hypothetical protein SAMN06265338_11121 [Rhodoblastus acidophilus]
MMNTTQICRRAPRKAGHESAPHLYVVGQSVRLKGGFAQRTLAKGVYHVTRTLPLLGEFPQYRIRNDDETHERLASQNELEAVDARSGGADLIARTFGHG